MSLTLYYHPLASYCHKVLIALYEAGTRFDGQIIDLSDEAHRAVLRAHWPLLKFPVLYDSTRKRSVPESSSIIEYLDRHYPGNTALVPSMRTAPSKCGYGIASSITTIRPRCGRLWRINPAGTRGRGSPTRAPWRQLPPHRFELLRRRGSHGTSASPTVAAPHSFLPARFSPAGCS
jgi:hypothetical protein